MKSQVRVRHRRRILCVFPRYAPSFGTFHHAYPLMDGVRAFMPPQGILVVAAYLPRAWEVRLVDENVRSVSDQELAWADAVFVTGCTSRKARSTLWHGGRGHWAKQRCWAVRQSPPLRSNI